MRARFDDTGMLDRVWIKLEKVAQEIIGANKCIHLLVQGDFERVGPHHSDGL